VAELLATASGEVTACCLRKPTAEQLRRARSERRYAEIESDGDKDLKLRVLITVMPYGLGTETRILQLIAPRAKRSCPQRRKRADGLSRTIRSFRWVARA
jgi:hypothetical protein